MSDSILVVDDSRVNRRLLRGILAHEGFEVREAANGREGIAQAVEQPPGLILLDIDMPVLDGFAVCGTLKGHPKTAEVPIVFLSSLDQASQKVRGLELGAADYVTKPFDRSEVVERVKTQLRLSGLTRSLRAVNSELVRQRKSLDEDLHAAAEIQRSLLPRADRKRGPLTMAWRYMPCTSIGGDIFNALELTAEETAFYVADVAGHGVPSALVSISISHRLSGRWLLGAAKATGQGETLGPAEVLARLDCEYPIERFNRYFTISYLVLNTTSGRLRYSSAGHPPPLVVRPNGAIERLSAGGPLIGLGEGLGFDEGEERLERGDRIVLYTDGVTEAPDRTGAMLGAPGLEALLVATRGLPAEGACAQLDAFLAQRCESVSAHDDVSFAIVDWVSA
jgi:sigma-B regulation protein RsbU (phosphoserine phosphatase)